MISEESIMEVEKPEEMMVIEINFVNGQQDDVVVNYGDKPEDLAEVFFFNLIKLSVHFLNYMFTVVGVCAEA